MPEAQILHILSTGLAIVVELYCDFIGETKAGIVGTPNGKQEVTFSILDLNEL